jgi:hypothetical protein
MHGRIVRGGVLFDGVALFGFDGDFAFFFLFGDFATWVAGTPVPGDYRSVALVWRVRLRHARSYGAAALDHDVMLWVATAARVQRSRSRAAHRAHAPRMNAKGQSSPLSPFSGSGMMTSICAVLDE